MRRRACRTAPGAGVVYAEGSEASYQMVLTRLSRTSRTSPELTNWEQICARWTPPQPSSHGSRSAAKTLRVPVFAPPKLMSLCCVYVAAW